MGSPTIVATPSNSMGSIVTFATAIKIKLYLTCICLLALLTTITAITTSQTATATTNNASNIFASSLEFNITATLENIENARADIITLIDEYWQSNRTFLPSKFLRLAFHDSVGGMDGCVDLTNIDNFGLRIPIDALRPIVDKYTSHSALSTNSSSVVRLSRADIWALACVIGVEKTQNIDHIVFPLQYIGRIDCDATAGKVCRDIHQEIVPCRVDFGPHRILPSAHLNTSGLAHYFKTNFNFTPRQTVAIMGAHTIGFANRNHSGFDGPKGWVRNPTEFNNGYYRMLVGAGNSVEEYIAEAPDWFKETFRNGDVQVAEIDGGAHTSNRTMPDQFYWLRRSDDNDPNSVNLIMTSSDIALVRDFETQMNYDKNVVRCDFLFSCFLDRKLQLQRKLQGTKVCPYAQTTGHIMAEYRNDNSKFLNDFREVLNLMMTVQYNIDSPTDEFRPLLPPADCTNCLIQVDFSIPKPTLVPTSLPTLSPTTQTPSKAPYTNNAPSQQHNHTPSNEPTSRSTSSSSTLSSMSLLGVLIGRLFFVQWC